MTWSPDCAIYELVYCFSPYYLNAHHLSEADVHYSLERGVHYSPALDVHYSSELGVHLYSGACFFSFGALFYECRKRFPRCWVLFRKWNVLHRDSVRLGANIDPYSSGPPHLFVFLAMFHHSLSALFLSLLDFCSQLCLINIKTD